MKKEVKKGCDKDQTLDIPPEMLDQWLSQGDGSAQGLLGPGGVVKQLTKALLERALSAELDHHLGYDKHDASGHGSGNSRNGYSEKTVKLDNGEVSLEIPRDRTGDFEPQIIPKHGRRFEGFDQQIIALYSRGMSTRDIKSQLEEMYEVEVSSSLISRVTEELQEEVSNWQNRRLDALYPIVYLDALVIKVKHEGRVTNKSFYLALGITTEGHKELLGIWVSEHEGARFWLSVLNELQSRGVDDILIACVDGLKGFPEAIESVYPHARVQLCIVHMIRNSTRYVSYKDRKAVCRDLKEIYKAATIEDAEEGLTRFSERWDGRYPMISQLWLNHWERVTPFFEFPAAIRKIVYTTNSVESLNMSLRKVIKNKRVFPSDSAAVKQLYMSLRLISKKWTMPIAQWGEALNQLSILFGERLDRHL